MKIATNTGFVPALTDYAHGIPMLRQAGFDCFDLSICCQIDTDGYFEGAEGEARAKEVRRIADASTAPSASRRIFRLRAANSAPPRARGFP